MAGRPGHPRFVATDAQRNMVRVMAINGVPQDDICEVIGCGKPVLHREFRRELDLGMIEANAKVTASLFRMAMNGNVAAAIFWLKARAGWRETDRVEKIIDSSAAQSSVTIFALPENGRETPQS